MLGVLLTVLLLLLSILCLLVRSSHRRSSQLPPGPAPWPIVGNLWQKDILPLHQSYEKVREQLAAPCSLHIPRQTKGGHTGDRFPPFLFSLSCSAKKAKIPTFLSTASTSLWLSAPLAGPTQ